MGEAVKRITSQGKNEEAQSVRESMPVFHRNLKEGKKIEEKLKVMVVLVVQKDGHA